MPEAKNAAGTIFEKEKNDIFQNTTPLLLTFKRGYFNDY